MLALMVPALLQVLALFQDQALNQCLQQQYQRH
jgi:hypothetical protein